MSAKLFGTPGSPESYQLRDLLQRNYPFTWVELRTHREGQQLLGMDLNDPRLPVCYRVEQLFIGPAPTNLHELWNGSNSQNTVSMTWRSTRRDRLDSAPRYTEPPKNCERFWSRSLQLEVNRQYFVLPQRHQVSSREVGTTRITRMKPMLIQAWLRELEAAPKTKGHIKAVVYRLYEKAML